MNNKANIAFAVLILDNQMTIEDVPETLQYGVTEVVNYFTKKDDEATTTEPSTEKSAATVPVTNAPAANKDAETKTMTINPTKEA